MQLLSRSDLDIQGSEAAVRTLAKKEGRLRTFDAKGANLPDRDDMVACLVDRMQRAIDPGNYIAKDRQVGIGHSIGDGLEFIRRFCGQSPADTQLPV